MSGPRRLYLPDRILVAVSDALDATHDICCRDRHHCVRRGDAAGVFCRYVLNSSLSWSDEAALVIFGWAAFLFIASAYLHDKHIHLDILVRRMPAAWQARASILAEGLAGGYLIALLVACIQAMEVVAKGRTDALQLPMSLHFIAIPVAVSVMMVHWMRRNVAGASVGTRRGSSLRSRWPISASSLLRSVNTFSCRDGCACQFWCWRCSGPMLIGVPVALSLGLMATLYVALVGNISFMTGGLQIFNGVNILRPAGDSAADPVRKADVQPRVSPNCSWISHKCWLAGFEADWGHRTSSQASSSATSPVRPFPTQPPSAR